MQYDYLKRFYDKYGEDYFKRIVNCVYDDSVLPITTEITNIAPTISALLGISFPVASTGNVIDFVINQY